VIATANDRDRGVNELSSAMRRRFNTVVLPLPDSEEEEVGIVRLRVEKLGDALELPSTPPVEEIRRLVTVFRELREASPRTARPSSRARPARCRPPRRSA
jgi:MoxR-like ATPase